MVFIKEWNERNEAANRQAIDTVLHEIGHNWDSSWEGNRYWGRLQDLHNRSKRSEFINRNARDNGVREDWAATFAGYFTASANRKAAVKDKLKVVDMFFASFT